MSNYFSEFSKCLKKYALFLKFLPEPYNYSGGFLVKYRWNRTVIHKDTTSKKKILKHPKTLNFELFSDFSKCLKKFALMKFLPEALN